MGCGQSTEGQAWANSTKKVVCDYFLFVFLYFCICTLVFWCSIVKTWVFFEKWRLSILLLLSIIVTDQLPKTWFWKLNKAFLHYFLSNFWHIWWFLKVERSKGAVELWKIIKYVAKNLAKIEEKPIPMPFKNPFYGWFRVPDPSLNSILMKSE